MVRRRAPPPPKHAPSRRAAYAAEDYLRAIATEFADDEDLQDMEARRYGLEAEHAYDVFDNGDADVAGNTGKHKQPEIVNTPFKRKKKSPPQRPFLGKRQVKLPPRFERAARSATEAAQLRGQNRALRILLRKDLGFQLSHMRSGESRGSLQPTLGLIKLRTLAERLSKLEGKVSRIKSNKSVHQQVSQMSHQIVNIARRERGLYSKPRVHNPVLTTSYRRRQTSRLHGKPQAIKPEVFPPPIQQPLPENPVTNDGSSRSRRSMMRQASRQVILVSPEIVESPISFLVSGPLGSRVISIPRAGKLEAILESYFMHETYDAYLTHGSKLLRGDLTPNSYNLHQGSQLVAHSRLRGGGAPSISSAIVNGCQNYRVTLPGQHNDLDLFMASMRQSFPDYEFLWEETNATLDWDGLKSCCIALRSCEHEWDLFEITCISDLSQTTCLFRADPYCVGGGGCYVHTDLFFGGQQGEEHTHVWVAGETFEHFLWRRNLPYELSYTLIVASGEPVKISLDTEWSPTYNHSYLTYRALGLGGNKGKKGAPQPQPQQQSRRKPIIPRKMQGGIKKGITGAGRLASQMVGGPLTRSLADHLSSKLSRLVGSGDYEIEDKTAINALINGHHKENTTFGAATCRIRYREFVCDITAGETGEFSSTTYLVNPGNAALFPWASTIAQNYECFHFNGVVVEIVSVTADAATSPNMGSIMVTSDPNVNAPAYDSKLKFDNSNSAVSTKLSNNLMYGLECKNQQQSSYYVTGPKTQSTPDNLVYMANIQVATVPGSAIPPGSPVAEMWISYDVTFHTPAVSIASTSVAGNSEYLMVQNMNGATLVTNKAWHYTILGDIVIPPPVVNYIDDGFNNSYGLTFNFGPDLKIGKYFFEVTLTFTDTTKQGTTMGPMTYVNCIMGARTSASSGSTPAITMDPGYSGATKDVSSGSGFKFVWRDILTVSGSNPKLTIPGVDLLVDGYVATLVNINACPDGYTQLLT